MKNAYKLQKTRSGIFAELYLPKRVGLQGIIYNSLTSGFKIDNIKKYLIENRASINNFINGKRIADYSDERVSQLNAIYFGYSMYEVDGVFLGGHEHYEERTQVIRFMFFPDINDIIESIPSMHSIDDCYDFIESYIDFIPSLKFITPPDATEHDENDESFIFRKNAWDKIRKWREDVELFFFGYLVHSICEFIVSENLGGTVDLEEEIWVTSFQNLQVTKALLYKLS